MDGPGPRAGDRVPPGRPGHGPPGLPPARARRKAGSQPRVVLLQPVPDTRPDRRRCLRGDRRRPGSPGCSGLPGHARPGAAAFDPVRAGVRIRVRDPVRASPLVVVSPVPRAAGGAGVNRSIWTWARRVGPVLVLAVLVWRLGTSP